MPEPVWREVGGVQQKRCPTCEARGRKPWHVVEEFGYDISNEPPLTIRCRQCKNEDWYRWADQNERSPQVQIDGGKSQRYYQRKVAAGWRKIDGKWIRRDDDG